MKEIGKKILIIVLLIGAVLLVSWLVWDNQRIVVTSFEVESEHLPDEFNGFRIVQVSDLHNDEFGRDNEKLLALIKEIKPDIIAITGDLLDSRRTSIEKALNFVMQASQIASCYYVTGNHESRMDEEFEQLEAGMIEAGVCVLRNEKVVLENDGAQITIAGIDDPRFATDTDKVEKMKPVIGDILKGILQDVQEKEFVLLLSHRPELFDMYCEQEIDVVLTGHVHGGQVRVPYIGGIIGPGQGILPDYDAGLYEADGTKMILSRGLGQSVMPFRVNNPPELVVLDLKSRE